MARLPPYNPSGTVVLSYISPLGDICSVTYNNVDAIKLSQIKHIINTK